MKKYHWPQRTACLLGIVLWTASTAAAGADRPPLSVAVIDFDYVDTSGEVRDQSAQHRARLETFMRTLKQDLVESGKYQVIPVACDPAPCSITDSDPGELIAAARDAGAKLLLFGGVHKMSTLVQFAKVQVVDIDRDEVVFRRSMSFRGDDDRSWLHAEAFLVKQLNEELTN